MIIFQLKRFINFQKLISNVLKSEPPKRIDKSDIYKIVFKQIDFSISVTIYDGFQFTLEGERFYFV